MQQGSAGMEGNRYKEVEKKYKQIKVTSEKELLEYAKTHAEVKMIDAQALTAENGEKLTKLGECEVCPGVRRPIFAFCPLDDEGNEHAGFYYIPNALDESTQRHLAEKCLTEYCEAPHTTNLHPLNQQMEQIWLKSVEWNAAKKKQGKDPMDQLHWAALGFHYDWTERTYPNEPGSQIPQALQELGEKCAKAVGYELKSEAALVNYYKKSSTMGGHQDNVEKTFNYPVVSLSIGCSSIFLKGGLTKETVPLEILLRSGDVVVMGGKSRLCFHGIAKTLPVDTLSAFPLNTDFPQEISSYLRSNRLNINVRQVYDYAHPNTVEGEDSPSRKRARVED